MRKHLQNSVRMREMADLKAGMEMNLSSLRCFCRAFQSEAAAGYTSVAPPVAPTVMLLPAIPTDGERDGGEGG